MNTLLLMALLWGCRMVDFDEDGLRADQDCDDLLDSVYPGADELCDGLDNDCDGVVDEDPIDGDYVYIDEDGDGFGTTAEYGLACDVPDGYADNGDDCDDEAPETSPAAEEVCDNLDNDCDHVVDNGLEFITWFRDEDGDGYGGPHVGIEDCAPGPNMSASSGDCNDDDPDTFPGAAALEDPVMCTRDADQDGYGDQNPSRYADPGADCDDEDPAIGPQSTEICGDFTDNDCDGLVDEGC